jgi:hypothetical protein
VQLATPGTSPLADRDADNLPDIYEIETYGSLSVVGSSSTGDTDGDGVSDEAEYVAGTSATDANSKPELKVSRLRSGEVVVAFQTQAINGPGYFGLERKYDLEQTTQIENPDAWSIVPGYFNLPATGEIVTCTNLNMNAVWFARVRVSLQ